MTDPTGRGSLLATRAGGADRSARCLPGARSQSTPGYGLLSTTALRTGADWVARLRGDPGRARTHRRIGFGGGRPHGGCGPIRRSARGSARSNPPKCIRDQEIERSLVGVAEIGDVPSERNFTINLLTPEYRGGKTNRADRLSTLCRKNWIGMRTGGEISSDSSQRPQAPHEFFVRVAEFFRRHLNG